MEHPFFQEGNVRRSIISTGLICFFVLIYFLAYVSVQAQTGDPPPDGRSEGIAPSSLPGPNAGAASVSQASNTVQVDRADAGEDPYAPWSRIAYQAIDHDNWDIFIAQADGSNAKNLTHHPAADVNPNIRKDLQRVVFDSDRNGHWQVYTVGVSGKDLVNFSKTLYDERDAEWSPDGKRLVMVSSKESDREIYLADPETGDRVRCTNHNGDDVFPTWSPDGRYIYWVRYRLSNGKWIGSVWRMNADCSHQQALQATLNGYSLMGPVFISPDGEKGLVSFDGSYDGFQDLYVIDISQGWEKEICKSYKYADMRAGGWSPDGKKILFNHIIWANAAGTELKNIYLERISDQDHEDRERLNVPANPIAHDWKSADFWPPTATMEPLPEFTRAISVLARWSGIDRGPAGIENYIVESWTTSFPNWQNLYGATTGTNTVYKVGPKQSGEILKFRVRAADRAGNRSTWTTDPDGDIQTQLYTSQIKGTITDARGVGLDGLTDVISPLPMNRVITKKGGRFVGYLKKQGAYTLSEKQSESFSQTAVNVGAGDVTVNRYLPPTNSLLQNGGFEDGLNGWQQSGTQTMASATLNSHSGSHAVQMGVNCAEPCLDEGEITSFASNLAIGPDGTAHILTLHQTEQGLEFLHYWRPEAGSWSQPEPVTTTTLDNNLDHYQFLVDRQGTIHLLWRSFQQILYIQKPAGGSWSRPEIVENNIVTISRFRYRMAVDGGGGAHVIYLCQGSLFYRERATSGKWLPRVMLRESGFYDADILTTDDETVHIVYSVFEYKGDWEIAAYHVKRGPDRIWQDPVTVSHDYIDQGLRSLELALAPDNGIHAYFSTGWLYSSYSPESGWSVPAPFLTFLEQVSLISDQTGRLHVFSRVNYPTLNTEYLIREPEGWKTYHYPNKIFNTQVERGLISIGRQGELHVMDWSQSSKYRSRQRAAQETDITLSQQVNLPADANKPTLAFEYNGRVIEGPGGAEFQVVVNEGEEETVVFTGTNTLGWNLAWADLTPWKGHTITVAFRFRQPQGAYLGQVLLDDVSLGEWLTPVVHSILPTRILTDWEGATITISGKNFISGAQVYFGGTKAASVRWIDDQHLEAVIPAGLRRGIHDISVKNPGSQRYILSAGINLGTYNYLPILVR